MVREHLAEISSICFPLSPPLHNTFGGVLHLGL
jgi:hypothetical protein